MFDDIKENFKSVIEFSQNISDPKIDYLFNKWEKNKEKFIKRFNDLIYEYPEPVEFTLDVNQKKVRAMDFAATVSDTFNNPTLAEFIDDNLDSFFENKVSTKSYPNIPEGMKLLKAFKYFEYNKKALRRIQDMASQIIQEDKIKGTLCFSVHPLDFLSSSENTYHWRSCHSLDGEYRAGNLSYMMDESTFMVYIKGADDQFLPAFGSTMWNSKKWRMLLHTNDNDTVLFAGRQYPFSSKSGIDLVLNIYNDLILKEKDTKTFNPFYSPEDLIYNTWKMDYIDSYISSDSNEKKYLKQKYLICDNSLINIEDIVLKGLNSLNYNDVLDSTHYNYPYYTFTHCDCYGYRTDINTILIHPIVIGEEVPCLHCGNELIFNSETMRCDDCELKYGTEENETYTYCDCCNTRIYTDNGYTIESNGDIICEACFREQAFICECCGNIYYNDDKVYDPEEDRWYCRDCYDSMNK